MRDFLDEYLALAEAEQRERDNSNATGDIFGDERVNQSPEDLFRKLGRIATAPAEDGARTGQGSPNPRGSETQAGRRQEAGRGAEAPPVSEAPSQATETGGAPRQEGPLQIADHLKRFPVGLRPMVKRMRELAAVRKPTWDQRFEMDLARFILNAFNAGRKTIPRENPRVCRDVLGGRAD
jgi:hypothetical protein